MQKLMFSYFGLTICAEIKHPLKVTMKIGLDSISIVPFQTEEWRNEVYPTQPAPFIFLNNGRTQCELAEFGLRPIWAKEKKYGTKTYNARSETVTESPSFKNAWNKRQFGLALMENFFEPNGETGKAVRWEIERKDAQPIAVASLWERFVDRYTGEVVFSFSMLTVNADGHPVMKHFHKPKYEKCSIVLENSNYLNWLHAYQGTALSSLRVQVRFSNIITCAPTKPNKQFKLRFIKT